MRIRHLFLISPVVLAACSDRVPTEGTSRPLSPASASRAVSMAPARPAVVPGQYIVMFRGGAPGTASAPQPAALAAAMARVRALLGSSGSRILHTYSHA